MAHSWRARGPLVTAGHGRPKRGLRTGAEKPAVGSQIAQQKATNGPRAGHGWATAGSPLDEPARAPLVALG
eukprot:10278150-Lingulodinium_polyedra.AAC.1